MEGERKYLKVCHKMFAAQHWRDLITRVWTHATEAGLSAGCGSRETHINDSTLHAVDRVEWDSKLTDDFHVIEIAYGKGFLISKRTGA